MWKLALLAYMPIAAVIFGFLGMILAVAVPRDMPFEDAAWAYYGAAALSFIGAAPVAWMVARRMLWRRERRMLDASSG
ncbi:hypothetical protein ACI6QG_11140 [Roseococcus sp. DSY-14]|uniref:hypothetical protein n=1 Tax=Roseococcus sp. DSY-14 TaxID=3369650 RepID=UPI00387B58E6